MDEMYLQGLRNFSICLNMAEYCWTSQNMPKISWINRFNMQRYSSNNIIIIIVTNYIILEFLSARFIYLVAVLPFYL